MIFAQMNKGLFILVYLAKAVHTHRIMPFLYLLLFMRDVDQVRQDNSLVWMINQIKKNLIFHTVKILVLLLSSSKQVLVNSPDLIPKGYAPHALFAIAMLKLSPITWVNLIISLRTQIGKAFSFLLVLGPSQVFADLGDPETHSSVDIKPWIAFSGQLESLWNIPKGTADFDCNH